MNSKKRIIYKPVCRECGSEKNLVTVKHAEGDYHLCKQHAPAWMKPASRAKTGGTK